METELIGFIAQLVTGIATFLVALVLVFQLKKQNQQLKIQHQDSNNKMSMDSIFIFEKLTIPNNYGDEFVNMMWKARIEGISNMSNKEIWEFQTWLTVANRRIIQHYIIDFGSQFTQLIARKVRELGKNPNSLQESEEEKRERLKNEDADSWDNCLWG